MDGSRFDWELQRENEAAALQTTDTIAGAGAFGETGAEFDDRPGAPTAAWAPVLIWTALGLTIAISAAL